MDKFAKNSRNDATATPIFPEPEGGRGSNSAELKKYAAAAEIVFLAQADRRRILGPGLAAETAWDIMLVLYCEWAQGKKLSTTDVGLATAIPSTSALRWLSIFEAKGVIVREDDPTDKRRTWITLTPKGAATVERCLERLAVMYQSIPK